jgi:predicted TIM-barrel fold metal-dependent hydrolase
LDQTGIRYACVLALEPNVSTDWVIQQSEKEPRVVSVLSVHPNDRMKKEKVKQYIQKGCQAIKLHPVIQDFSPKAKEVFDLMEEIKPHRLPVLCHTGCFSIPHLQERREFGNINNFVPLVQQFPEIPFIMCHMNLLHPEDAIALARRFENIYLETSWQTPRNVKKAISAVGSERVLFGSDWPYAYQHTSLSIIKKACANDQAFQNVVSNNAKRLLRLP